MHLRLLKRLVTDEDSILREGLKSRGIEVRVLSSDGETASYLNYLLRKNALIITDFGFAGDHLSSLIEENANVVRVLNESVKEAERCAVLGKKLKVNVVVGYGGGRPLDVAKYVAKKLGKPLVLFPTAPSHDGIASGVSSLLMENNKKVTVETKHPNAVYVPMQLWKNAERLKKSGILDVLSNFVSLQDVSLGIVVIGERINRDQFKLAVSSLIFSLKSNKNDEFLLKALLSSSLAGIGEKGSRYISGSEHEVEKVLTLRIGKHLHGEYVGLGSLISAFVYKSVNVHNLLFDKDDLFDVLIWSMKRNDALDSVANVLNDKDVVKKAHIHLKHVSNVRPERYTLWSHVNSKDVDFGEVIKEIKHTLV